jgi:hypothetical protein
MPQGNQMDIKTLSLSVAAVAANSRKSFFFARYIIVRFFVAFYL